MILCQNRFPGQRRRRRYGHCPSSWSHTSSFFVWRHIWRFWFVCRNEFINVRRIRKPFHDMVNVLLATGLSNPIQFQTLQMARCQKELALAKIKTKVRYPSSLIHQLSKLSFEHASPDPPLSLVFITLLPIVLMMGNAKHDVSFRLIVCHQLKVGINRLLNPATTIRGIVGWAVRSTGFLDNVGTAAEPKAWCTLVVRVVQLY